ncbi:MAG: efflux RND transporter periplasmic adaptor subunit [Verrucomicrobiota bacterium]
MKRILWSKRLVLIGGGLGLALLGWRLAAQNSSEGSSLPEPGSDARILPVETLFISRQDSYEVDDRFLGEVEPGRTSQLGFELAGTLVAVFADEGDVVEAGQVVAELDMARLSAAKQEQEALLADAEASLKLAETTYKRTHKLALTGAVSEQELDEVIQRRDGAKASVNRVKAAIQRIDVDLAKSRLVAPYRGRIAIRHVDEGTSVGPGQVALELIESGSLEARIGVGARMAREVSEGDEVVLQRVGSDGSVNARVRQVAPQQNRRTRTVDVLLAITEAGAVMPGDLLAWTIKNTVVADGAWVSRSALTSSKRGLWAVYVALTVADSAEHRLERRDVEVLHVDDDRAFVRGGVREGQRFVVDGLQRLVPGQSVTLAAE